MPYSFSFCAIFSLFASLYAFWSGRLASDSHGLHRVRQYILLSLVKFEKSETGLTVSHCLHGLDSILDIKYSWDFFKRFVCILTCDDYDVNESVVMLAPSIAS